VKKRGTTLRTRRFIAITEEVFTSPSWRALPLPALRLWLVLRSLYNGSNNGKITPTYVAMRRAGWTSKDTLGRALTALVDHGFIRYTRKAGKNCFHRASLIAFTDLDTPRDDEEGIAGCQATNAFLAWQPAAAAPKRKPPPRKPKNAIPVPRGGTAPADGEQPPRPTGNGGPEPTRPTGNVEMPGNPSGARVSGDLGVLSSRSDRVPARGV
jgi:hypothetical protein